MKLIGKRACFAPIVLMTVTVLFINSCSMLKDIAEVKNPEIKIENVHISDFTFNEVQLLFDVSIRNPNSFSAKLSGFDYDFKINENTFLRGEQNSDLAIPGNEISNIQIPLTLQFSELYNTFNSLAGQDSMDYQIVTGIFVELPVVGRKRFPVSKSGTLPVVQIPKIKVDKIQLNKLGFTGADLTLDIQIDNPNTFDLVVNQLNYDLTINGKGWAKGLISKTVEINRNQPALISLPIQLDFLQMGQSVYQLVTGKQDLNYELNGDLHLNTSYELLKNLNLPIEKSGKLTIIK